MPENTTEAATTENTATTTAAADEATPKQAKAEAKAQAKAIEDAKAETARLAKDNEDLRASLAKLSSAVEALTAAKAADVKAPEPAGVAAPSSYRPVTLRNNTPAPFYYDDLNGANTPDKGVALKAAVKLTEQQYKRRTPAQWGVLVANEVVTLEGVPEGDLAAFEDARDAEDRRLSNHSAYDQVERQVMAGKFTI